MKPWTGLGLLLASVGIIIAAACIGILGVLVLAAFNPGVKGPHITDRQAVIAFVIGSLLGGGLAAVLLAWIRRR